MTLDLPPDSPVAGLPWVITIGPLGDEEDWEPVVCGPYERVHALALAQAVVADEQLMAVVEPLLPLVGAEAIRDEIELARAAAEPGDEPGGDDADQYELRHGQEDDPDRAVEQWETRHVRPGPVPTDDELLAGFARVAASLPHP